MARLQVPQSKINTMQMEAEKNNTFYESMINLPNEEIVAIAQGPIEHLNSTDHNHSCVLCHNILVGSDFFTSSETGA